MLILYFKYFNLFNNINLFNIIKEHDYFNRSRRFGCVFYPGFNCRNKFEKTNKKLVSKLQLNTFNARNEILIGKKVVGQQ